MTIPTEIPPIAEFPKDGRRWRLDWLGAVDRNPNVPTEPRITAIISPVREGVANPATEKDVVGEERQRIEIGVRQWPYLRIGSVWQNGRVRREAAGEKLTLTGIDIAPDTVARIAADFTTSPGRWLIPPFLYQVGKFGLSARCLAIPYGGDPYGIILPSAEAIRFYYAGSSDLAAIALSGMYGHSLDSIINTKPNYSGFDPVRKRCVLRLRKWLADDDAWTIGRVLHDPDAAQGVARVYASLVKGSHAGKPAYPDCGLPFCSRVRWIARGLEIKLPDSPPRYLVFELLRCSSPFPFDELEVTRDNSNKRADPTTDIPHGNKLPAWVLPRKVRDPSRERELQSGSEPLAFTERLKLPLTGERFDFLLGKKVITDATPKTTAPYRSGRLQPLGAVDGTQMGTGAGNRDGEGIMPADVVIRRHRSRGLPASFETLAAAVRHLDSWEGVSAKVRIGIVDDITVPLLREPNQPQWAYLDRKHRIMRRVMAADIDFRGRHFCFIEYEQRPSERRAAGLISIEDCGQIFDSLFFQVLDTLSLCEGSWAPSNYLHLGIRCQRLIHTWPNAEACATALVSKMSQAL